MFCNCIGACMNLKFIQLNRVKNKRSWNKSKRKNSGTFGVG